MKLVARKDFREVSEFSRKGYDYKKIEECDEYMVWEMTRYDKETKVRKFIGWEIWKPKWYKNPDGSKVWANPSDEDFGDYGWYCTSKSKLEQRKQEIRNRYGTNKKVDRCSVECN